MGLRMKTLLFCAFTEKSDVYGDVGEGGGAAVREKPI